MLPMERDSFEKRKLFNELENQTSKTNVFKNHYDNLKNYLFSKTDSHNDFLSLIYNIDTYVKKTEQKCDNIRNRKFTQLLNHNNTYFIKSE